MNQAPADGGEGSAPSAVLFVCLGNICRSPLAEGIFKAMVRDRAGGREILAESCGLGDWHVGSPADHRSIAIAKRHGIMLEGRARVLNPVDDFGRFGLIIPMDRANRRGLVELGARPERVRLMRSFDPELAGVQEDRMDVPDPYSGQQRDFEEVFLMLQRACAGLVEHLLVSRRC